MPFLVGAVDPGITAMAIVVVDLETMRITRATPLSPLDIAKKECRKEPVRKRTVAPRKRRVSPNMLISAREVPIIASHLIRNQYPEYFLKKHKIQFVYIEYQFRSRMKQLCSRMCDVMKETKVRHHVSSMKSVRSYYGISVSAKDVKGRDKKQKTYKMRKDLSMTVCDEIIHTDDQQMLRDIADRYWAGRTTKTPGERRDKIEKCYGDLVEATYHALFPGNWMPLLQRAYLGVEEASPEDMTEAKMAKVPFEEFNAVLPRSVIEGFRAYYQKKAARVRAKRK